jgi:Arc/MetJ family transcription regulator
MDILPNCIDKYIHIVYIADMKTTLNIDDQILRKASRLTGISEKTTLVRKGLEALIAQESAKRLAALGGSEKKLKSIPRRKSNKE